MQRAKPYLSDQKNHLKGCKDTSSNEWKEMSFAGNHEQRNKLPDQIPLQYFHTNLCPRSPPFLENARINAMRIAGQNFRKFVIYLLPYRFVVLDSQSCLVLYIFFLSFQSVNVELL